MFRKTTRQVFSRLVIPTSTRRSALTRRREAYPGKDGEPELIIPVIHDMFHQESILVSLDRCPFAQA